MWADKWQIVDKNYKVSESTDQKAHTYRLRKCFPKVLTSRRKSWKKFLKIVNGSQVTIWPAKSVCHITYNPLHFWAWKVNKPLQFYLPFTVTCMQPYFCHFPRLSYVNFHFPLLGAAILLPFFKRTSISEVLTRESKVAHVDTFFNVHLCVKV